MLKGFLLIEVFIIFVVFEKLSRLTLTPYLYKNESLESFMSCQRRPYLICKIYQFPLEKVCLSVNIFNAVFEGLELSDFGCRGL